MKLIKWDNIRAQIETAKDIDELTGLKNKLRAYQILAEQSKQSQEVQAKIAIYKARADRKCGEWLRENIKVGGDRKSKSKSQDVTLKNGEWLRENIKVGGQNKKARSEDMTSLKEIGITKNENDRRSKKAIKKNFTSRMLCL